MTEPFCNCHTSNQWPPNFVHRVVIAKFNCFIILSPPDKKLPLQFHSSEENDENKNIKLRIPWVNLGLFSVCSVLSCQWWTCGASAEHQPQPIPHCWPSHKPESKLVRVYLVHLAGWWFPGHCPKEASPQKHLKNKEWHNVKNIKTTETEPYTAVLTSEYGDKTLPTRRDHSNQKQSWDSTNFSQSTALWIGGIQGAGTGFLWKN